MTLQQLWFVLLVWHYSCFSSAMAVDRSKFRTCDQTGFCRTHRHRPPKADEPPPGEKTTPTTADDDTTEYYRLENVEFYENGIPVDHDGSSSSSGGSKKQNKKNKSKSLWNSLASRTLLGGGSSSNKQEEPPPPVAYTRLTGILTVVGSSSSSSPSFLNLAIAILPDATIRLRITDPLRVRPTYDELVLQPNIMVQNEPLPNVTYYPDETAVTNVLRARGIVVSVSTPSIGLAFGSSGLLQIQLSPFYVVLYEGSQKVAAAGQRFYFDRRPMAQDEEVVVPHSKEEEDTVGTTKKHDKEVVGYWEDGLAIYADGTREERTAEPAETEEEEAAEGQDTMAADNEAQAQQQRRLQEKKKKDGYDGAETFGGHTDTKPHGPQSVGMQLEHYDTQFLYGIPEHASSATLQSTIGGPDAHYREPYRLYNLDVFEYELDETMALYGSIPLLISHSATSGTTSGFFWFNPTETFVDVELSSSSKSGNDQNADSNPSTTYWMSESGIVDLFFLTGPTVPDVYRQYMQLTGPTPLPPIFSLGYHQCRWNYKNIADVYQVHDHFEQYDYPYDVLWLDIEHTDGKRYFTWDTNEFPLAQVPEMQYKLAKHGRRMVTIIDPHIKRDNNYYIHKQATAKGLYIKKEDGKDDFDGWCWPGSSSYLDFTDAKVRQWWADQFQYGNYKGSTEYLFTWNDMNEPSVFNGPEVSMSKTLVNLAGEEHREWHNLYGMLFHRATMEGLVQRCQHTGSSSKKNPLPSSTTQKRPFVLSRAFFAGSQKYGAVWTGDNAAEWGHLAIATPMLLSLNVAGLSFVGADVGGFFGDPDAELFTRWMQAGAYQPFFRGHAHHDSKRREPWMFGDETLRRLRRAALARYALVPYLYTVFWLTEQTGMPVMRMMWMEYPKTIALFAVDDQFLVGSDLLVVPVTKAGVTQVNVVFPTDHVWYDAESLDRVTDGTTIIKGSTTTILVPADIDTIPVYQRGGSIISRKLRLRRSTMMMKNDPYTLYIALDPTENAVGTLHVDDEDSFAYQKGEYTDVVVSANATSITNAVKWKGYDSVSTVERILLAGLTRTPKRIAVQGGEELDFTQKSSDLIIIRKPDLLITTGWSISIEY
jgi:mannosyl-oligosaccharide alpha-1,3-glucosidase